VHPSYSVILFTTASGAGYGLLVWLATLRALDVVPPAPATGFIGMGSALALITAGLLSSTAHLGRPERAWRAFSQWRTSWLSREGVAAVATYAPAGLLGIGWGIFGLGGPAMALTGIAAAALALATVWCTGMIYASLRTIRQWNQPLTAPVYVALALATGGVLANAMLAIMDQASAGVTAAAAAALVAALALKFFYWRAIDREASPYTLETATGLGRFGKVRPLDPPHTQANFLMREMGYCVARKHASRLRAIAYALLFAAPLALLLATLAPALAGAVTSLAAMAALSAMIGVIVERWLFFAEATHASMLYYGYKV
jgi:DMSO reductase anchor subunit